MKYIFLIISVLILIIGLFVFNNSGTDANKMVKNKIKKILDKCLVQKKGCNVDLKGLKAKIRLDNNIFYLKPFKIFVWDESVRQENIESIKVSFKMKNMNMGKTQFIFKKAVANNKQRWSATGLLPICVTGRVDWSSLLEINTKDNQYFLSFPITVKKASD